MSYTSVVNVLKLFLEEIGHFKSNKEFLSTVLIKIALFSHFCAGSDIKTNVFQFLNFWEN